MAIDERLERLTERHEALTQSLELFQHDMAESLAQMRSAAAERDAQYERRFVTLPRRRIPTTSSANLYATAD